jgi:cyanophycinase
MSIFGLLGSGEFEPWSVEVDRWALEHASGDGRVLILPTASALEGAAVFDTWSVKGLTHYASLDVPAEVVPLKTRDDAEREDLAARVRDASVVYFSGGNPAYLAATLAGSTFWNGVLAEMERGLAYIGCSAGVACLGSSAPDSGVRDFGEQLWQPGLGVFPGTWFGPHWDALDSFVPGLTEFIVSSVPTGQTLLAIDENTAVLGEGVDWSVVGASGAHVYRDGDWTDHPAGTTFPLDLAARR